MSNQRKGYIRKVLEDGSIEETVVYLPDKPSPKRKPKKAKRAKVLEVEVEENDKDNQIKKEKQTPRSSQTPISIKRTES